MISAKGPQDKKCTLQILLRFIGTSRTKIRLTSTCLQGRNLQLARVSDNYQVTVGASFCQILHLDNNQMSVVPPTEKPPSINGSICNADELDIVVGFVNHQRKSYKDYTPSLSQTFFKNLNAIELPSVLFLSVHFY